MMEFLSGYRVGPLRLSFSWDSSVLRFSGVLLSKTVGCLKVLRRRDRCIKLLFHKEAAIRRGDRLQINVYKYFSSFTFINTLQK